MYHNKNFYPINIPDDYSTMKFTIESFADVANKLQKILRITIIPQIKFFIYLFLLY